MNAWGFRPDASKLVVTRCTPPRMAVVVAGHAVPPMEVAFPPAALTRDRVYALRLAEGWHGATSHVTWHVLVTDVSDVRKYWPGKMTQCDDLGWDDPNLFALVFVPRCATMIHDGNIHTRRSPWATRQTSRADDEIIHRQLVVEYMDGEERFYDLRAEGASWREGKRGLTVKEKPGASRIHIPWTNVRSYSVEIRHAPAADDVQGPPGA